MRDLNHLNLVTLCFVVAIGVWGAILNFVRRIKNASPLSLFKKITLFLVDLISSSGIAIISYLAIKGFGYNDLLAVAFAGIMAHQGTRAIYLIELTILEKLGAMQTMNEVKNMYCIFNPNNKQDKNENEGQ